LPNTTAYTQWYDKIKEVQTNRYDVVLALANERDVRTHLAHQNYPIVLHATTGKNWLSQMHRHIPGYDDCIVCRMEDLKELNFECSNGVIGQKLEGQNKNNDAALPFLSASSGLMLASTLYKLQTEAILDDPCNDWRIDFSSEYKMASKGKRKCRAECNILWPKKIRKNVNKKTKWASLEP